MMKYFIPIVMFVFLSQSCTSSKDVFELSPRQIMLMTGKGQGQDGAINPYAGSKCIAIVKNLTNNPFDVRIQYKGEIVEMIKIKKKEKREIVLEKGYELYFETDFEAKIRLTFRKY